MDVIPAKAGIQYAGKAEINPIGRGVLGRPVEPGDDSGVLANRNPVMTLLPLT